MSRGVLVYVAGVVVAAAAASGFVITDPCSAVAALSPTTAGLMVLFGLAALLADLRPIVTPGGSQTTVDSSIFVASVLLIGPQWTLPVVAFSIVGCHLLTRRPPVRMVFNLAQYSLAVGLGGTALYRLLGDGCGATISWTSPRDILAVLAFLLIYYVLNTGLVAIVVGLHEGQSILRTWQSSNVELLPQFSAMYVVGVMAAMLWSVTPASMALIGFIVMIIYVSFSLAESLKIAQQDLLLRMGQLERRTAELTLLNDVGAALPGGVDLEGLWALIHDRLRLLLGTDDLSVATVDLETHDFDVVFERVARPLEPSERSAFVELWHQAIEAAQPVIGGLPEVGGGAPRARPPAAIVVPILFDGRPIGVLGARSTRACQFGDEDARFLVVVADQIAIAIENARLRRQAAELEAIEQLNRLKTEFISTVSHELRSPLTPIVGYAELLSLRTFSPDLTRQMAGEIHRETLHLQRLVDDLLDISRIEAGRLRLDAQPLHLDDAIRQVVREYSVSPQHRFEQLVDAGLPVVLSDPTRVRQVLGNLLGNAVKYSPRGGQITISARETEGAVEVSVTDEGVGIPSDKLDRVFEKFYRVEGDVTRRVRGTGLGLAICKHIVEAHGGRIWAESAGTDQGSTFYFTLPVAQQPLPTDSMAAAAVE